MGGVRVLVGVQLGPVVEVHRLHGPGAMRVSVHGGRDAHPVHPVVGQVFVLHTMMNRHMSDSRCNFSMNSWETSFNKMYFLKVE